MALWFTATGRWEDIEWTWGVPGQRSLHTNPSGRPELPLQPHTKLWLCANTKLSQLTNNSLLLSGWRRAGTMQTGARGPDLHRLDALKRTPAALGNAHSAKQNTVLWINLLSKGEKNSILQWMADYDKGGAGWFLLDSYKKSSSGRSHSSKSQPHYLLVLKSNNLYVEFPFQNPVAWTADYTINSTCTFCQSSYCGISCPGEWRCSTAAYYCTT